MSQTQDPAMELEPKGQLLTPNHMLEAWGAFLGYAGPGPTLHHPDITGVWWGPAI